MVMQGGAARSECSLNLLVAKMYIP